MAHTDSGIVGNSLLAANAAAIVAIAGGTLVLAGWYFDIATLTTIAVGYVSMQPNTALCFVLAGAALLFQSPLLDSTRAPRSKLKLLATACATSVAVVAVATLFEYFFSINIGIDTLLIRQATAAEPIQYPGRMSPATAIEFLLLGLALAFADIETHRRIRPAQYLALLTTLLGFVALLGYLYNVRSLSQVDVYSTMALHTALLFVLLGSGALLSRPDKGLMAHITSRHVGGAMARSILPFAIVVPVVVGWLRLLGERAGWYGTEFGLALFATSNVLIFTFLVWRNARSLNKADIVRLQSDETIENAAAELRKTVQLLEVSRERHRLAVEAAGLGTWHLNAQTDELQCSDICLGLYGIALGTPMNRQRLLEVIHPDDRALASGMRQRIEAGQSDFYIQYRVIFPDSSERWLAVKGQGYYDAAGRATSMQGVAMDITARKKDENDRERIHAQLRQSQKLNALGTLAAGIAHDFNNVLAAIAGNTKLLIEEVAVNHPALTSLAEIDKATVRASDLVRRILAFGRGQDSNPAATQLQPIVEEAVKLLRASVPAMIEFRMQYTQDVPNVFVDASQIHQVIMNLATNAVQAIGEHHGLIDVCIDVARVNGDLAHTYADLREGPYVRLAISDSGCGMDKAIIERIFEPFYTTKAPGRGTGLGLSVAHGIVRSCGGTITVYSQPGKGTKFHVYLPATQETTTPVAHFEKENVNGRGERVIYVDDEEALIFLVTRSLERHNYRVSGYTDPAQALAVFREQSQNFEVVVTDLSMPRMSGFDLARELLRVRPDIPIIMTSGYVRREDSEAAHRLGIRELIAKPNSIEDLGHALTRLFVAETDRRR